MFMSPPLTSNVPQKRRKVESRAAVITHEEYPTSSSQRSVRVVSSARASSSAVPSEHDNLPPIPLPLRERLINRAVASNDHFQVKVNDYVIIKYKKRKQELTPLFYAGIVIRQGNIPEVTSWQVQCFRRHGSRVGQFVKPHKKDIANYEASHIVAILSNPKIVNHVFHFSDDFSSYLPYLC
jgi:hypothetical protein